MKSRSLRRENQNTVVKKRLKSYSRRVSFWRGYESPNGEIIFNPSWVDFIGGHEYNHLKSGSISSRYRYSRYNSKYSPNRLHKYRDVRLKGESTGTREKDKQMAYKIIKNELSEYYSNR